MAHIDKSFDKKYQEYQIPKKQKTMEEICFPKKYELQIPQKFVPQYINPKTSNKSILIFHKIGAGKTCTAINVGEAWKHTRDVIFVAPASLISNFRNEMRTQCANDEYITPKEREQLKHHHPSSKEYKQIIQTSNERIDKYYQIYSYNKFADGLINKTISLKNAILMIDEVQNIVSEKGSYYHTINEAIKKAPSNLRIVLLSATPLYDRPVEIALTMNLLRIPLLFPTGREFDKMFIKDDKAINLNKFKEMITGYVSYFRGAPPYTFPTSIVKHVNCIMSDFQYRSYLTVIENESREIKQHRTKSGFKKGQLKELPNDFFIGTRIVSNIAFPEKRINESGLKILNGRYLKLNHLEKYSIKFFKILRRINKLTGTAFIYSNFKGYGGLTSLSKILEGNGYKNYTEHGEGKRRYAFWTGDESHESRDEIKSVFNQANNYNGSKLKILLISSAGKEGLSLYRCQQAHIIDPYWNQSRLDQIIGRAVRYCSHKDMDIDKQLVKVYIYVATHPNEKETIDQHIVKIAAKKDKLIKQFELALKEVAVDCKLFKNANVFKGEDDIQCVR